MRVVEPIVSRSVATAHSTARADRTAHAADLQKLWWGGWGSNPRPKDYESDPPRPGWSGCALIEPGQPVRSEPTSCPVGPPPVGLRSKPVAVPRSPRAESELPTGGRAPAPMRPLLGECTAPRRALGSWPFVAFHSSRSATRFVTTNPVETRGRTMANTGRPAPVVCSECGAAAPDDPDPRRCGMPKTWEHYNPEACPECVQTSQRLSLIHI